MPSAVEGLPGIDKLPVVDGFRQRGLAPTRLETFLDAGFVFALTLLVIVQGDATHSLDDLFLALKRIPSFAACFLLITRYWCAHNRWSRQFGVDDARTTFLSLSLMFVVLVYVFPLRLVFASAFAFVSGGYFPAGFGLNSTDDLEWLFVIYGVGFIALTGILMRLHQHALGKEVELGLDELEVQITREEIGSFRIQMLSGLASIAFAVLLLVFPPQSSWMAGGPGFMYSSMAIVMPIYHGRMGKKRSAIEARRRGLAA